MTGLSAQEARARIPDRGLAPPQLSAVAPGVLAYVQPDGSWMINNTGVLVGRTSTVLVDTTSTEVRNRALLAAVGEATGDRPVRTVVNTHHGDHTFGNWLLGPVPPSSARPRAGRRCCGPASSPARCFSPTTGTRSWRRRR